MTRTLNDIMEFDHIIHVDWNGYVTEPDKDEKGKSLWAPEVEFLPGDWEMGTRADVYVGGEWEAMMGCTGQYGYNGPIMHESEFIGGGMERRILETPGYYVCAVVEKDYDEETDDRELVGWVCLYREDDWHNPECTKCEHEHRHDWCQVCDDHAEAVCAGYGDVPCDCGNNHDR